MIYYDFNISSIPWWAWVSAGFAAGAYLHSPRIRHIIHYTVIIILRGLTWLLRRTDSLDRETANGTTVPVVTPPPTFNNGKGSKPSLADGELEALFSKNPDLALANRPGPRATSGPKVSIRDGKGVDVAYPTGRKVSYFYNHMLSEGVK